jgi:hypothetical protein
MNPRSAQKYGEAWRLLFLNIGIIKLNAHTFEPLDSQLAHSF